MKLSMNIKDRVTLKRKTGPKAGEKGVIVKLHVKDGKVKTAGVLWDSDWPINALSNFQQPGKVFYYKSEDLKVIDTWKV